MYVPNLYGLFEHPIDKAVKVLPNGNEFPYSFVCSNCDIFRVAQDAKKRSSGNHALFADTPKEMTRIMAF